MAAEEALVCAYVLTDDGVQITPRCFKRSLVTETPLLGPERGRGADHGIRDDVLHLKSGFEKYVLPEHISPHSKVRVSAISARFYNAEGSPCIVCLEYLCQ